MSVFSGRRAAVLFAAVALTPLAQAHAADCAPGGASALAVGTVVQVAPGAARTYALNLSRGEGVIVDLMNLEAAPPAAASADEHEHDEHRPATTDDRPRGLKLCDQSGALLAPMAGEVFAKGGSLTATPDGQRLRFVAPVAGQYLVSVAAGDAAREVLVRRRNVESAQTPIVSATLDGTRNGITSSGAPMVFSFNGTAGQWVELKSTSEKDTVLRLAGPDRAGDYSLIAENDDSDGLNPMIRRKLPVTGTYYLQVDSLSEEAGAFTLTTKRIEAPKPPPPPMALRPGAAVSGRLADGNDAKLYALQVVAGHTYRLELTASYDGVVAIGVPNPVEPDGGSSAADAGFAEIKSQDSGTSGTEKLDFTARTSGQLLVRVKSFGTGETDGDYTLKATDNGG